MKKQYKRPIAESVVLMPHANTLLITSLEKTDEEMGGGGALSGEHRNDWENIWKEMLACCCDYFFSLIFDHVT